MTLDGNSSLPLVSVVIPCYNYGHYLPDALESALSQPGVRVEVIIVDDASTDGSDAVAQRLARSDPRVRLIQHEHNKGHIATYNDGLAAIVGEYVVLLSADDLLAPGSLRRSTELMRRHPNVGLVYGYAPDFTETPPAQKPIPPRFTTWSGETWLRRLCERGSNAIMNPEAILRGSLMAELVGYDETMPQSADMDLWMRAAARADVGRVSGPDQAYYRVHDSNMHLTDFKGLIADTRARRDTFDRFFAQDGSSLPDADELHARARRSIAIESVRYAYRTSLEPSEASTEVPDELAALAVETWPQIEGTRIWSKYSGSRSSSVPRARRFVDSRMHDARWALRWRRWRRTGL